MGEPFKPNSSILAYADNGISTPSRLVRGRALRRALGFVTIAWLFGSVWATATAGAPLTEFARHLHASNFQFGLLSALPFIASLASMPASYLTERTGARKKIFMISLLTQRLLWIPIALLPLWMMRNGGLLPVRAAMLVFLSLLFLMYIAGNIGGPAWTSWMADLVPERSRGTYFSRRRQLGIVSGIPVALIVGAVMDHQIASNGARVLIVCASIFVVAAFFGIIDIELFHPVPAIPTRPKAGGHLLRAMGRPLRDRQFLYFTGFVATMTFAVSFMGQFVTLYLIELIKATNVQTQMIVLVAPMVAVFLILPVWGRAVDRMGKKPVLALSSLGMVLVGLGWCFMTRGNVWLGYVLSAAGGLLWAGVEVANFNMQLEMSASYHDEDSGTSFIAVNSIIINTAGCMGGLASGVIAQKLATLQWHPAGFKTFTFYDILFALSGSLRLLAVVVFLPFIHEPTARPARETLRFMTANIYNDLFSAILQPLRFVGLSRAESYVEENPLKNK